MDDVLGHASTLLRLYWAGDNLGAVSLKLLGGTLAPKLVYFVLKKELLNLSEWHPG